VSIFHVFNMSEQNATVLAGLGSRRGVLAERSQFGAGRGSPARVFAPRRSSCVAIRIEISFAIRMDDFSQIYRSIVVLTYDKSLISWIFELDIDGRRRAPGVLHNSFYFAKRVHNGAA
jgi:hypothetical protein